MNIFNFKIWLEDEQKNYEFYKNLILGKLNTEKTKVNTSTSLNMWKPAENLVSALDSLGEFKSLDDDLQDRVRDKILSSEGTLDDIIRMMAKEGKK